MKLTKSLWIVILFNVAYIIAFTLYYISIQNYEFLIYILVLVIVAVIVATTVSRTNLDNIALWGLSIWGLLHMMGGGLYINGKTLYALKIIELVNHGGDFYILKMDQVIHFYGFAVAALVLFQLCWPYFKKENKKSLAIFIAWVGGMGLGALNEVVEFIAFITLAKTGVGDVYNTGFDLIFNLLGSLAGSIIAYFIYRNRIKR